MAEVIWMFWAGVLVGLLVGVWYGSRKQAERAERLRSYLYRIAHMSGYNPKKATGTATYMHGLAEEALRGDV